MPPELVGISPYGLHLTWNMFPTGNEPLMFGGGYADTNNQQLQYGMPTLFK